MTPSAQGHLAMLTFSALIAGSFPLGAMVANEIAPVALNAVRFAIAAAVIGAVVVARGGVPRKALAAPWRYGLLGGLLALYFVLMFEGLKTALPVSAAAVFTLTPAIAAVAGWALLRQVTTGRIALALALGGVGALVTIFRADLQAALAFEVGRGEAIYFAGCVAHAVYTPLVRRLNRGESALVFTFGTLVAGAVVMMALGWPALVATDWGALRPMVWVTIAYTALAASAGSFVALQFATMRLPAAKVMAYTYLVPCWVALWGVTLGGAVPPAGVLAGVALTLVALGLLLKEEEPSARSA